MHHSCGLHAPFQAAYSRRKTVIEYSPETGQAQEYRNLAKAIDENTMFTIPKPMSQERLEEILLEYGLLESVEDYTI
ncbi:MAG: hypothetical protein VB085_03005 [Peptococcaceae bacterium]|nr:hypothetical protein [Peptococcaceae bacterium]